ncbi:MAG: type II secretion system secretin GspD [Pseudohongiellaceae bacterium]
MMRLNNNVQMLLLVFCLFSLSPLQAQQSVSGPDWTPNFRDTDVREVIRAVQDATGKTVIIDPRVRGEITVISSAPVDAQGYYSIFLRALDMAGFTAVETDDGVISILPSQEVRTAPLPLRTAQSAQLRGGNEYVTELIALDNVPVNRILPVLRPLVSQSNGQMSAFTEGNLLVVVDTVANIARVRALVEQMDAAVTPETERVSLDFASAETLVETLRQILGADATVAEESGADQRRARVTADSRSNAVLVSGELRQRQLVRELIGLLDQPQQQSGNTRVIYLEYADAKNIAEVLSNVVTNMAEVGNSDDSGARELATIEADAQTNALIITADSDMIDTLQNIIQRLDVQRAQVLVEAIIVEISDDAGRNLGIQWLLRNDSGAFGGSFDSGNNPLALERIGEGVLAEDGAAGLAALVSGLAGSAGQTLGLGRLDGSTDLLALIDMLQATSGANILSTPNLLTTDNTAAEISVGENVPFLTGSFSNTGGGGNVQNPFQTISRENVGTTLRVTPHVNQGDRVALDIYQEISSISQRAGAVDLITNERRIETRVSVANGETVVLGGLIRDNVVQNETRVPLLGSVPGVGRLFRSRETEVRKTNLLVFIRPTILRDDAALRGATAAKYDFIRDQQLEQRLRNDYLIELDDLPLLPEWSSIQLESNGADIQAVEDNTVDDEAANNDR